MLQEIWRVLAPGGRLLAVVPNRSGIWARVEAIPFGCGRPFGKTQLTALLRDALFSPLNWTEALAVPPFRARSLLGSGVGTGRTDAVAGVTRVVGVAWRRPNSSTRGCRRGPGRGLVPYKSNAVNRPAFFPKARYKARARIEQAVGKLKRFKRSQLSARAKPRPAAGAQASGCSPARFSRL